MMLWAAHFNLVYWPSTLLEQAPQPQIRLLLWRAQKWRRANGTAVPDSKKKKHSMIIVVFVNILWGWMKWPPKSTRFIKINCFLCKSDSGVWQYVQILFHFFIFIDELSILGWSAKASKSVKLPKSVGTMCKTNTSDLWAFWCQWSSSLLND